jgi:hypothetical protein
LTPLVWQLIPIPAGEFVVIAKKDSTARAMVNTLILNGFAVFMAFLW